MQTEISRHEPMIRGIGLSDAGMQPRQVLREDKVKGRVWKTVAAWVSYALRQGQSFKTVLYPASVRESSVLSAENIA
jgi:hypothetical protein